MRAKLPEESRYELRQFQLVPMSPAPKPRHQKIVRNLFRLFDSFVATHQLGEVFFAPIDVVFEEGEVCQPDLVFVHKDQAHSIQETAIEGAPTLLVEVVSKGSVARDYIEKKEDYEKFGVQEYWIVDSHNEVVLVYTLEQSKYLLFSSNEESDSIQSRVLNGLRTSTAEVFAV